MNERQLVIIFFFSMFLCWGCQNDEDFVPVYEVPEEFQPHVEQFIREGNQRGHSLVITNLLIRYDSTLDQNFCATCNSKDLTKKVQRIVSINKNYQCWENEYQLEALIFHELGHCILGRGHTSELLSSGDPKSLMIINDISIYSPCVYDIGGGDCNQLFKRDYYLDELFDESTPAPAWAE